MKFSTTAIVALAGLTQAHKCPPRNPDGIAAGNELIDWTISAANSLFPVHPGWQKAFDRTFSKNLYSTANSTAYDFKGLKALFVELEPVLTDFFNGTFFHGFKNVVGVPHADDRGGIVMLTGWEGGYVGGDHSNTRNATNAAMAVIEEQHCQRKIVEWREMSNLAMG